MREALIRLPQDLPRQIHSHVFSLRLLMVELNPSFENLSKLIATGSVQELEQLERSPFLHDRGYPDMWSGFMRELQANDNGRSGTCDQSIKYVLSNSVNGNELSGKLAWMIRVVWTATGQDSRRRELICNILRHGLRNQTEADRLFEYLLGTAKNINLDKLQELVNIVEKFRSSLPVSGRNFGRREFEPSRSSW